MKKYGIDYLVCKCLDSSFKNSWIVKTLSYLDSDQAHSWAVKELHARNKKVSEIAKEFLEEGDTHKARCKALSQAEFDIESVTCEEVVSIYQYSSIIEEEDTLDDSDLKELYRSLCEGFLSEVDTELFELRKKVGQMEDKVEQLESELSTAYENSEA
jgi:hypothetical protein